MSEIHTCPECGATACYWCGGVPCGHDAPCCCGRRGVRIMRTWYDDVADGEIVVLAERIDPYPSDSPADVVRRIEDEGLEFEVDRNDVASDPDGSRWDMTGMAPGALVKVEAFVYGWPPHVMARIARLARSRRRPPIPGVVGSFDPATGEFRTGSAR